jgi:hypothetical protein
MSIEAMKQALEALESVYGKGKKCNAAITSLRQAIQEEALRNVVRLGQEIEAEAEKQEPVAMRYDFDGYGYKYIDRGSGGDWQTRIKDAEPLYTHPQPKREWVGLTHEEKQKFLGGDAYGATLHDINAIEAKLKEKNT